MSYFYISFVMSKQASFSLDTNKHASMSLVCLRLVTEHRGRHHAKCSQRRLGAPSSFNAEISHEKAGFLKSPSSSVKSRC